MRASVARTAVVALALVLALGVRADATIDSAAAAAAAPVPPCAAAVRFGVLPTWARAGFSGERPRIPHTLGSSGRIAAILFGYPLRSPPAQGRNNKILWVERNPSKGFGSLWIRAQRMRDRVDLGAPVSRVVSGGPGPSIVDLPQPGCWRLTLTWSGRSDTLDLAYGSP